MIDLARALFALGIATAVGSLLDHVVRFTPRSPAKWPLRALSTLVLSYLVHVLPLLLVALVVTGFVVRPKLLPSARRAWPRGDRGWAFVGVTLLTAMTMLRSPTTLYWDEMVWLAKARIEAASPGALTPEALRIGTSAIPPGYPLFEPLSISALAGYGTSTRALVFGAELLTIVAGSVLLLTALDRRHVRVRSDLAAAILACACPLVLVHLRSAYVDLELGMLVAALLLLLEARETRAAVVVALAIVPMKDEGMAHVLAVSSIVILLALRRGEKRAALHAALVAGIGYSSFAGWRRRLLSSGVVDSDHLLGAPSLTRGSDVLHRALVAASDALGWGGLWAAVAGMIVAGALRPSTMNRRTRARCLVLGAQAALLFGAILCAPDRVMAFVHAGTLLPRLLVQLAPSAMLALSSSFTDESASVFDLGV